MRGKPKLISSRFWLAKEIEMKVHGLWRSHRAMKAAKERYPEFRWWIEYNEFHQYAVDRAISEIPINEILIRCCARYFRMKKVNPTARQWNALVQKVSERSGWNHWRTVHAALYLEGKGFVSSKAHLVIRSEFEVPRPRIDRYEAHKRLMRIRYRHFGGEEKYKEIIESINSEYESTGLKWCELPTKENPFEYKCIVCGKPVGHFFMHNFRMPGSGLRIEENERCYENRTGAISCHSKKCRAITHYVKKQRLDNSSTNYLLKVINECTKNKGDNAVFRGLAKHIARYA